MMKRLLSLCVALVATIWLWANTVITYTAPEELPETTSYSSGEGLHTHAYSDWVGVNHTFSNGVGTISFDCELTSDCEIDIIANYLFLGCTELTSVIIPEGITQIGSRAFSGCTNLSSVVIPEGVTSIGFCAFEGCSSLSSITLPETVTEIEYGAFDGCTNLVSINIPEGISSIGTFQRCSSLISINIPEGITEIGGNAFNGCSSLISITIPEGVTITGGWSSDGCSSLTSINIPEDVTITGEWSSEGCSNLSSVIIPVGITSLGWSALSGCTNLVSITIPESVTEIKYGAFEGCSKLSSVTIPEGVTSIERNTFKDCSSLTSVTIPESVTEIKYGAFRGCSKLSSVTIPEGVTSIERSTFYNCSSLESVIIPNSVETIGNFAFGDCVKLVSVTIPESVTTIEDDAFARCYGIRSIDIPNSVINIGKEAFNGVGNVVYSGIAEGAPWGAYYLNAYLDGEVLYSNTDQVEILKCYDTASGEIIIPNTVTEITNSAFYGCSGLTSVIIPEGVIEIGSYAFQGCSGLTSITIPNTVTRIGLYVFVGCSSLSSITCEAETPPMFTLWAMGLIPDDVPVYVPCGTLDAYQLSWSSHYSNIQEMECEPEEYRRDVTSGNYGTICLPKAVAQEALEDCGGVFFKIVYAVTNTNDEVTGILMEEESEGLEAGKAYIFRATADELVLPYTGAAVAEPVVANGLVGNLSETPLNVPQDMYVLSNNQIRKLAGGTATAGQNRAYIDLTNVTKLNYVPAAAPNRVVLNVEGSNVATDLENIKSEDIQKVIRDGQLLILREGKTYNVLGNTL